MELKNFLYLLLGKKGIDHLTCIIKKQNPKEYKEIILQTNYLPKNCKFTERIYQIINDLKERPKCVNCNKNIVSFYSFNIGYATHCSKKCSKNDKIVIEKYKQTNLKLYGVENVAKSKKFQNKKKDTCLKKYGTEYPFQAEEIKEKIKHLFLERYGVENPFQAEEIKEKIKQTSLERYGVEYLNQLEKVKEKSRQTKKEKYGSGYYNNRNKYKKTNLEKYGCEYYNNMEKIEKTKLEKYGNKYYNNIDKSVQTKLKNGYNSHFSYRGNYKEFHYDSSWELAFIKYCLVNDIKIERNKKGFVYWYEDKKHKYYPDFYLPEVDLFIEIKGRIFDKNKEKAKWNQFSYKLDVYNKEKLINNNIWQTKK